ncbi:hypothetical protein nbrc107696_39420 [Gordonia spumicola]|uniref:TM7S3/TM198-like domain-containing protein n=1 Tax=Gordonia spumicola TaxID=589161 RepID=A0A7I9VDR3_9ACTN|nr:hypothetical protein nbrc107696_39420 [Gordonia spumicola]
MIGVIACAVGALFCLRGVIAMRVVIALWGAFLGLSVGGGTIASIMGESVLSSLTGWVVGIAVALTFAVLAYVYYSVAVIIAVGSVGFVLGTAVMTATDITWNWAVITGGVIAGVVLAIIAIVADFPALLLVVITAYGGSAVMTAGIMLITGTLTAEEIVHTSISTDPSDAWWWYALQVALMIVGIVVQSRLVGDERTMRQHWKADA